MGENIRSRSGRIEGSLFGPRLRACHLFEEPPTLDQLSRAPRTGSRRHVIHRLSLPTAGGAVSVVAPVAALFHPDHADIGRSATASIFMGLVSP
jgi:hypothetical protein